MAEELFLDCILRKIDFNRLLQKDQSTSGFAPLVDFSFFGGGL